MKYLLIAIAVGWYPIEFNNQEACEAAIAQLDKKTAHPSGGLPYVRPSKYLICVPKGE